MPIRFARLTGLTALALMAAACSSSWVTVVDSSPAESAWQLTYHNAHSQPVTCDARVQFISESEADNLDYGHREATFTIPPNSRRAIDYPEPVIDAPPGSLDGYGYRVLYQNHQGSAEGLYLTCVEAE